MVYFDCRDGDDGDDFVLSDTLPCQYDASWWHFSRQVFWSLIIYVAMYLFCVVYEARWEKIVDHQYWAKEWVGSLTKKPKKGLLEATLRVAQLVAQRWQRAVHVRDDHARAAARSPLSEKAALRRARASSGRS